MATMPNFFRRNDHPAPGPKGAPEAIQRNPFRLRALPQEDVFFYCKKIDNSRLVREADPKTGGACWSAIGAAGILLVLLTGVLAPSVAGTLAGYKIEALKVEEQRLLGERQVLDLREAELLSPARLQELAERQNLVTPKLGQVVHLEGNRPSSAVAMVK